MSEPTVKKVSDGLMTLMVNPDTDLAYMTTGYAADYQRRQKEIEANCRSITETPLGATPEELAANNRYWKEYGRPAALRELDIYFGQGRRPKDTT